MIQESILKMDQRLRMKKSMDKCPLLRTPHGKPAKNTTLVYRDTLESLWLIDKLEPWRDQF
ncbi:hypothetical protein AGMMS50268_01080 [Spirochaetia bacterium]|nr:hypothetical protein AGMMS50268_01080 [Spirochaetia bacterium]